jgi:hypothetical protein
VIKSLSGVHYADVFKCAVNQCTIFQHDDAGYYAAFFNLYQVVFYARGPRETA